MSINGDQVLYTFGECLKKYIVAKNTRSTGGEEEVTGSGPSANATQT